MADAIGEQPESFAFPGTSASNLAVIEANTVDSRADSGKSVTDAAKSIADRPETMPDSPKSTQNPCASIRNNGKSEENVAESLTAKTKSDAKAGDDVRRLTLREN